MVLLLLQAGALYRQNSLFRYICGCVFDMRICVLWEMVVVAEGVDGGRWTVLTSSSGGFSLVAGQLSCFMLFRSSGSCSQLNRGAVECPSVAIERRTLGTLNFREWGLQEHHKL